MPEEIELKTKSQPSQAGSLFWYVSVGEMRINLILWTNQLSGYISV